MRYEFVFEFESGMEIWKEYQVIEVAWYSDPVVIGDYELEVKAKHLRKLGYVLSKAAVIEINKQ